MSDFDEDDGDAIDAMVPNLKAVALEKVPATLQPSWACHSDLDASLYDYCEYISPVIQYYADFQDINRVCHHATLLDNATNAYRRLVLPMSVSQDSIRHLVLALGAMALAAEQHDPSHRLKATVLRHKQKSLQCLRHDLSHPKVAASDHNLVAVQLMCVLDVSIT